MMQSFRPASGHLRAGRAMLALASLLLIGACGDATAPIDEARSARARWDRTHPADYDVTLGIGCFCPQELVSPVLVKVRGGIVTSRTYVATGQGVDPRFAGFFPTVDGLFTEIEEAAKRGSQIEATYDARYGYPREVAIDREHWAVDGGSRIAVSDFRPL